MALISCPQCGGQVSDSSEKCVHCGYDFLKVKKQEEEAKIFSNLPYEEQERLLKEFNARYPEEAKFEKYEKAYNVGVKVAGALDALLTIVQLIVVILLVTSKIDDSKGLKLIIAFAILLIAVVACTIILRVYFRKKLTVRAYQNIKRFGRWLKQEKGLNYKIVLTSEEKAAFDSVRI